MEANAIRRRTAPGVKIRVRPGKIKYDLFIDIEAGTNISKKIEEDDFSLKLTYFDGTTQAKEPLHFEKLRKKCDHVLKKLARSAYVIKTEEYKLSLTIGPSFYALPEAIREAEIRRQEGKKAKKKKKKKVGVMPSRDGYPRRSQVTNYTRNNVFRPYQGGRCSPK